MASKRVLIVDDSRSARHVLKRQLKQYDIIVDEVESAEDALQYLLYNKPHAIFMDHMMPGMDGLQAVRVIKGNPATGLIPIVMFTSKEGGEVYLNQARALGAAGVLPKQIESSDLEAVLDSLRLFEVPEDPVRISDAEAATTVDAPDRPVSAFDAAEVQSAARSPQLDAVQREAADDELLRLLKPHLDAQARRLQASMRSELRHLSEKLKADSRPPRRRLVAAAAGLVVGVFLTSSFYNMLPARSQPAAYAALGAAGAPGIEACLQAEVRP
jgi:CheY-like chemotaxis protein